MDSPNLYPGLRVYGLGAGAGSETNEIVRYSMCIIVHGRMFCIVYYYIVAGPKSRSLLERGEAASSVQADLRMMASRRTWGVKA